MNKLTIEQQFALYTIAGTDKYGKIDITDIIRTMQSETDEDYITAGIVSSIVALTNQDRQCFFYGSAVDCVEQLMELLSDREEEVSAAMADLNKLIKKTNDKKIADEDKIILAEQERSLALTTDDKKAAKSWLLSFGWTETNTGGGCMVMFKDFICTDGETRMVGIDGENPDGALYPVDMAAYDAGWDGDLCDDCSTDENNLLCQFQSDEIKTANCRYADSYGISL